MPNASSPYLSVPAACAASSLISFFELQGSDVKALSVQTREVGERSWSVLDTEAVLELKAGLKAAVGQIAKEQ